MARLRWSGDPGRSGATVKQCGSRQGGGWYGQRQAGWQQARLVQQARPVAVRDGSCVGVGVGDIDLRWKAECESGRLDDSGTEADTD